jgi:low affinity Fe/Cu permease
MNNFFLRIARGTAKGIGHPVAFVIATVLVIAWALSGPALNYSENWQLVINTATSVLTFLMIFLLQNTQNRDARAMHVKLDELLRAVHGARTELVDLENVTEEELEKYCSEFKSLHVRYAELLAKRRNKREPVANHAQVSSPTSVTTRVRRKAVRQT